jgi:hypothetical protein
MRWWVPLALLAATGGAAAFEQAALFAAFKAVFPPRDGSEILSDEAVFAAEARRHLALLGAPANMSALCALPEERVLELLMKASLGNLVMSEDPEAPGKIAQPYQADPVSGRVVFVDSYASNRLVVFQVLVFGLLLALAHSWFVRGAA